MIYNLAYKDIYYTATGETFTYVVRLGDTGVYFGTAVKSPEEDNITINIGNIVSQYLETRMLDFRNFHNNVTLHGNGTLDFDLYKVTFKDVIIDGQQTRVAEETLVETYRFLVGWDYGDEWDGGDKVLSNPVNGVLDPRMKIFYSAYLNTASSITIDSECTITGDTPTTGSTPSWSGGGGDTPIIYRFTLLGGNGVRLNSETGTWEIDYETNYPSVYYVFSGSTGIRQTGYASGRSISFYIPQNTGDSRDFNVQFYPDAGGVLLTGATAVQTNVNGDVDYTFSFNNQQGEELPSTDMSNYVSWSSTYPLVSYSVSRDGVVLYTGTTSQSGITVGFPENTDTESGVTYTFTASYMGEEIGTLTWTQDAAEEPIEYFFEFETPDYAVIESSVTAYTISWLTNYPEINFTCGTLTGTTTGSSVTLGLPQSGETFEFKAYSPDGDLLGTLHWRRILDYSREYFTVEFVEYDRLNSLTVETRTLTPLYYSVDDGATWTELPPAPEDTHIYAQRILFKGDRARMQVEGLANRKYIVYGNIMSLEHGDNFIGKTTHNYISQHFHHMFRNSASEANTGIVDARNLVLPAENLPGYCYYQMFEGCTNLKRAPKSLPAMVLSRSCYEDMFLNCFNLVQGPDVLPAVVLYTECYHAMFMDCNLQTAPSISALYLAESCCQSMFYGCGLLTTAPDLLAETLATNCYRTMFYDTSVTYVKCLAKNNISGNTIKWLGNPPEAIGTFIKDADAVWERSYDGIPESWTVSNA